MSALLPTGSTSRWRRIRRFILDRDNHRCMVPLPDGRTCLQPATHVDHIVARVLGGTDHPTNLRAACQQCNLRRGTATGHVKVTRQRKAWTW